MTKRLRVIGMVVAALTILTGSVSAYSNDEKVINYRERNVAETYITTAETIEELLEEQNIEIFEGDRLFYGDKETTDLAEELKAGKDIFVKRAFPIDVIIDGVTYITLVTDEKVKDVEEMYADVLGENYELKSNFTQNSPVRKGMNIVFETTRYEVEVIEIPEAFETIYIDNPDVPIGEFVVTQEGAKGVRTYTYTRTYTGGKYVKIEETSEVTTEPVNRIIERAPGFVSIYEIGEIKYSETMEMNVTAYTPYCAGVDNTTASGTQVRRGVCAVDTTVIPFGTKLFVPGYGVAVAEDRGGAIKGNKLDLYMESYEEAIKWGRRNLTVYILE